MSEAQASSIEGKNVLVTGATDGIGKATARRLAELGAAVWIVGRDAAKADRVAEEIRSAAGHDRVGTLVADLSLMAGVQRLAGQVAAELPRLDVLVNNVGALFKQRQVTAEGFECTFALNHLGYFLLTHHLRPLLTASAPARIVSVASEAHRGTDLDFDDLQGEEHYSAWRAYQRSKLANILFTYELAHRLEGTAVTANALHPGFVASRFGHDNGGWVAFVLKLGQKLLALDVEKGSNTSVHLATSPEVEGITGHYFDKCQPKPSSAESRVPQTRQRLWTETERLLEPWLDSVDRSE